MLQEVYAIIACVFSVAMCVVVVYFLLTSKRDRDADEAARDYFSAHGHWPGEDPT